MAVSLYPWVLVCVRNSAFIVIFIVTFYATGLAVNMIEVADYSLMLHWSANRRLVYLALRVSSRELSEKNHRTERGLDWLAATHTHTDRQNLRCNLYIITQKAGEIVKRCLR